LEATRIFVVYAKRERRMLERVSVPIVADVTHQEESVCCADRPVTIAGTTSVHDHDGRIVAHDEGTITTSPTGFVGHGTDT
jgi:hypothetical protein